MLKKLDDESRWSKIEPKRPFRSVRLQGAGPGGAQQEWAVVGRPLGKAQMFFSVATGWEETGAQLGSGWIKNTLVMLVVVTREENGRRRFTWSCFGSVSVEAKHEFKLEPLIWTKKFLWTSGWENRGNSIWIPQGIDEIILEFPRTLLEMMESIPKNTTADRDFLEKTTMLWLAYRRGFLGLGLTPKRRWVSEFSGGASSSTAHGVVVRLLTAAL